MTDDTPLRAALLRAEEWMTKGAADRDEQAYEVIEQCIAALSAALLTGGRETTQVKRFVHWVKTTPHGSLVGDSKVAYAAQVRILDQLLWFLEGKDEYLEICVASAEQRPAPPAGEGGD